MVSDNTVKLIKLTFGVTKGSDEPVKNRDSGIIKVISKINNQPGEAVLFLTE
jgi:hypothetical protein